MFSGCVVLTTDHQIFEFARLDVRQSILISAVVGAMTLQSGVDLYLSAVFCQDSVQCGWG